MKVDLRHIAYGLAALAIAGLATFWFGWINIGASTGHWSVTDWVLHTAMRRSVIARANVSPPDNFPSDAMVRRAAGHYQSACAPCHGSPIDEPSPVVSAMTPAPPKLEDRIEEWKAEELFWIVKHGVKFTGMPAWPAQNRDDEIWSMVAFLEALPEMDASTYRALAFGDTSTSDPQARTLSAQSRSALVDCVRCHGQDGLGSTTGAFPRLDIQSGHYLREALFAYASANRSSGIMEHAVSGLTEEDLDALAEYYGSRPIAQLPSTSADQALLRRGEEIAILGIPDEDVAACSGCHDETLTGNRVMFPRLAGQYRIYLEQQLRLFANEEETRGGGMFAHLMAQASHDLSESDIKAVAAWYATQAPIATAEQ